MNREKQPETFGRALVELSRSMYYPETCLVGERADTGSAHPYSEALSKYPALRGVEMAAVRALDILHQCEREADRIVGRKH